MVWPRFGDLKCIAGEADRGMTIRLMQPPCPSDLMPACLAVADGFIPVSQPKRLIAALAMPQHARWLAHCPVSNCHGALARGTGFAFGYRDCCGLANGRCLVAMGKEFEE